MGKTKHSITYYITLLVIKLKGVKKDFSKAPIDYKKIRKEDIHHPSGKFLKQNSESPFKILKTSITEVKSDNASNKLLLFVHGGAFISGPSKIHWDTLQFIAKQTNHVIWMCDYPKAPEHQITEISNNIDAVYTAALNKYDSNQISLIGDSVGGTLVTALMQRLIRNKAQLPHKVILVSPVMDASLTNSEIDKVDKVDPMLSKQGVLSAKKMCAGDVDLKNEMISPLYGSFDNFPETVLFMAENDITYPDQKLAAIKLTEANVKVELIAGKGMPHIWPYLPVMKEAKLALNKIVAQLNNK